MRTLPILCHFIPASLASFAQRLRQAARSPWIHKKVMARKAWILHTFLRSINWNFPGKALLLLWRIVPISSSLNLHTIISLLFGTRIRSRIKCAKTDKCRAPVSTLLKLAGIFSAAQNAHSGVKSFSILWAIPLSTITHIAQSPSHPTTRK